MALADLTLIITNHAYEQYCQRVMNMERNALHLKITEQLKGNKQRKGEFLKLEDVWWVFLIESNELKFVTCYGRSLFDLPRALNWAKHHDDRIKLGESTW